MKNSIFEMLSTDTLKNRIAVYCFIYSLLGLMLQFFYYTKYDFVFYSFLGSGFIAIILLIFRQKEFYLRLNGSKISNALNMLISSFFWFIVFFFATIGYFKLVVFSFCDEMKFSTEVTIIDKKTGFNHGDTFILIIDSDYFSDYLKVGKKSYNKFEIGDNFDIYFYSRCGFDYLKPGVINQFNRQKM